ncbi:hypothetical protein FHW89_003436 [Mucilaginibacter sp. SG564]|nr:hypothetical protein [Mucilaginibacter sp. SG564]
MEFFRVFFVGFYPGFEQKNVKIQGLKSFSDNQRLKTGIVKAVIKV